MTPICPEKFNDTIIDEVLNATCHSSGKWIPDPAQFTCLSFTTVPPGAEIYYIIDPLIP